MSLLKRGSCAALKRSAAWPGGCCVWRGGRHQRGRFVFAQPVGGGVADRAIIRDPLETDPFSRSRPESLRLPPRRRLTTITARSRQQIGKDTRQHQPEEYGMPRSPSAPNEPYLNCSSSFAKTCGSSRKNFSQVKEATDREQDTRQWPRPRARSQFLGERFIGSSLRAVIKKFSEFHERVFLLGRERVP